MLEKLKKAESLLARIEGGLLVALLSVMVTLSFLQVLQRQLFGTGLLWGDTFLRHLVLWVGFLGAALAAADGKHFAWEAVSHKPGRLGAALRALAHLAAAAISGFLTSASWSFFLQEKEAGKTLFSVGGHAVHEWLFALSIPVGFALVLAHSLLRSAHAAAELKR